VKDGSRIRIAGEGGAGARGAKGDLYLIVKMLPDNRFERKDNDLYADVSVPLVTAVLGGEVPVMTLKGKLALKIPPETQNGNVIRLGGQGMPVLGSSDYGDFYAKVHVVLPVKLSAKEKQLFEQLKDLSGAR
jgi:DnaJ-class molecular chaperone